MPTSIQKGGQKGTFLGLFLDGVISLKTCSRLHGSSILEDRPDPQSTKKGVFFVVSAKGMLTAFFEIFGHFGVPAGAQKSLKTVFLGFWGASVKVDNFLAQQVKPRDLNGGEEGPP